MNVISVTELNYTLDVHAYKRGYFVRGYCYFWLILWWNHNYTQNVPVAVIIKKMLNKIHQSTVTILTFSWFCKHHITCKKLEKSWPNMSKIKSIFILAIRTKGRQETVSVLIINIVFDKKCISRKPVPLFFEFMNWWVVFIANSVTWPLYRLTTGFLGVSPDTVYTQRSF